MQMSRENPRQINQIAAYDTESFTIGSVRYTTSLILTPDRIVTDWRADSFAALRSEDLALLCEFSPEVVLLGTGARQRFPAPVLLRPLIEAGVGCEVMDTGSACRTFNLLAAEGRAVVAALLCQGMD